MIKGLKINKFGFAACALLSAGTALADTNYYLLSNGPFLQDWSNIGLITANDNWSGVPSITGYLGDIGATSITNVDPQTHLSPALSATIDAIANLTLPNTTTAGGVAEFEIADPTVALQGSGTADAPNLVLYFDLTGMEQIQVAYVLRDIDGSADNAIQQVALQYRVGNTGDFVNLPAGYVADASTGGTATQTTNVSVTLPVDVNNQPQVEVRIITSNAGGNDEWIGVDNINVTGLVTVPEPSALLSVLGGTAMLAGFRRRSR